MNIHKSAAISGGTGGKTLRKKQICPRSLIDGIQIKSNRTAVTPHGKARLRNAKNFDSNVQGTLADVDGSIGIHPL